MNDVTVCIKTFLHDPQLFRCIETLKATYPDIKIFVSDDGRVDKHEEMHKLGVDLYQFVLPFDSLGLTGGRNQLLEQVTTPYFVICDDDSIWTVEARLGDLKRLMDISDIACGTVRTLGKIGHYEGFWSWTGDGGMNYLPLIPDKSNTYEGVHFERVDLADEFFMAKTEIFKKLQWDENLHVTYQHSDFFLSCYKAGVKVVYAPDCIIDHKSADLPQTDEYGFFRYHKDIENYKNYFLKKWGLKYIKLFDGSIDSLTT